MTGSLARSRTGAWANSHVRAVVRLDDGSDVSYRDVRRFGTWLVLRADELDSYLAARLGLEPLERGFSASKLAERLEGRRGPIQAALLGQRKLAGGGDIYADEGLRSGERRGGK